MTSDNNGFQVTDLHLVADTLSSGVRPLLDTADGVPEPPSAGASSAAIAGAMAAIARAASGIVRSGVVAGTRVTIAGERYRNTELRVAEAFGANR